MKIRFFTHLSEDGKETYQDKELQYWDEEYEVWDKIPEIIAKGNSEWKEAHANKNYGEKI